MVAALGSAPPAPAAVVEAAPAPAPATEAAAAALVEAVELEDQVDEIIASAVEGINLALSMDDPLGFLVMSPVSREPEIQGEPPQVSSISSPLSQGE